MVVLRPTLSSGPESLNFYSSAMRDLAVNRGVVEFKPLSKLSHNGETLVLVVLPRDCAYL